MTHNLAKIGPSAIDLFRSRACETVLRGRKILVKNSDFASALVVLTAASRSQHRAKMRAQYRIHG